MRRQVGGEAGGLDARAMAGAAGAVVHLAGLLATCVQPCDSPGNSGLPSSTSAKMQPMLHMSVACRQCANVANVSTRNTR